MLKHKKILVTGASGYLGSWMAELARRQGADVRILLRGIPAHLKSWASQFDCVFGDITLKDSLTAACRDRQIIWHTASSNEVICQQDPSQAVLVNMYGTANLLEAATEVPLFIKFSTFHVYGRGGGEKITEETVPTPSSFYGLTNLCGDQLALFYRRTNHRKIIIARISNGYGAPLFREVNRWSLLINSLCRMAMERKEIALRGAGREHRDYVSIQDIFQAIMLISSMPHDEALFHVGGESSCSALEIVKTVKQIYDQRYKTDLPLQTGTEAGENPQKVLFDISRLKALGYRPSHRMTDEIHGLFNLLERPL